jgi:hypothetical protein
MSSHVTFEGLEELKAALRDLPATLTQEATGIVQGAAEAARAEIAAAYPRRAGTLADSLTVTTPIAGPAGVSVTLRATAKEARWFEFGTQTRQTKLGANRGPMPAKPTFYPRANAHRAQMLEDLAEMLRREGLLVSGTP